MQKILATIVSINTNIRNTILVGFVVFGVFALFAQLTSPYDIKVRRPEEKLITYQQEIGDFLKHAKPKTEKDERIVDAVRNVYCGVFGLACDENYDTFSNANFDKSAMGKVANLMSTPYTNPPALGSYYVMHQLNEMGIMPKAYAAEGLGFAGLAPFMNIWKKLRDISFLIIALVMIFSGFLIMFRTKMDPHHAVTLESALPKVVIAMILINFSFAIAGFMIDLMYIATGIIIVIFGPLISPDLSLSSMLDHFMSPNPIELLNLGIGNYEGSVLGGILGLKRLFYNTPYALLGMFGTTIRTIFIFVSGRIIGILLWVWIADKIVIRIGDLFDTPTIAAVVTLIVVALVGIPILAISEILPVIVIGFFVFLTALWVFARLLVLTFRTYIKILFYVMLSPFILIMEALPGSNAFISWAQTIFVELLTFPLIIAIFLLSGAFSNAISNGQLLALPFVSALNPESLGTIVAFSIIFMIPDLVDAVKAKFAPQGVNIPLGFNLFSGTSRPMKALYSSPRGMYFAKQLYATTSLGKAIKATLKWEGPGKSGH
jgi:hypothetical protein